MERLTNKNEQGILCSFSQDIWDILPSEDVEIVQTFIDKLAKYENTGLEPEELANLQQENKQLKQQLAEKDKLLEKENKALEIACEKIEDLRFENADICDYEYNEIKTEIRIKLLLEEAEEALKKLNKE